MAGIPKGKPKNLPGLLDFELTCSLTSLQENSLFNTLSRSSLILFLVQELSISAASRTNVLNPLLLISDK